ncbi:hypothetical protein BDA96_07G113500 [Sorghum bicolor]|uniref:PGG domain-containing protein n=2 Tax=Sorghum bicolor TaxID=4558 RepID=A0A1Z5R974_SORBI|nr:hypothetical protein BDA96_07G113500 [Sorghum bicolor]OQU80298.1 hypothetical protein SORBI_3007G107200 [Sorghum bicolor]
MAAAAMHPYTRQPYVRPSHTTTMHPRLLMAARLGDTQRLKNLLDDGRSVSVGAHVVRVEGSSSSSGPSAATPLTTTACGSSCSLLHVVAASGDGDEFLESAKVIHDRARHLLGIPDSNGDTPLHLAARAGNARMVSHLIHLAKTTDDDVAGEEGHGGADESRSSRLVKELLRGENRRGETVLHDAVRVGSRCMVIRLMEEDPELASFPREEGRGASPLYLAVVMEEVAIARSLHDMSHGSLSYAGPNGQNALHAAVLRGKVMTAMLLGWNEGLTEQGDHDGCTPLHFATSQQPEEGRSLPCRISNKFPWVRLSAADIPLLLLQTNPCSAYCRDAGGAFPIHVAAAVGAHKAVTTLLGMSPDSAGLQDAGGRTFLHVAVEKKRHSVVKHACRAPSLAWILNMQDKDGNTALHLAVKAGDTRTFFLLFGNRQVRMDLANNDGQTCRDLSLIDIPPGLSYKWNPKQMIHRALTRARAAHGIRRWDQFEEECILRPRREDEEKESEKLNNSTQTLGISSVLIVTVTFGATFALPGGYIADDHANGGAPTLAGRRAFRVFVVANALAFICSSLGTVGLMYSGITTVDLPIRQRHFLRSLFFVSSSLTCLVVAFASGSYTVLSPVAHSTAVAICVISMVVIVYRSLGRFQRMYALAAPLYVRAGIQPLLRLAKDIFTRMLRLYWPFIVIFTWAACATNHDA